MVGAGEGRKDEAEGGWVVFIHNKAEKNVRLFALRRSGGREERSLLLGLKEAEGRVWL